jgi:purine-cytosine permease-like protein
MNKLKRYAGLVWIIAGPLIFILLLMAAWYNIDSEGKKDINNPVPWVIIIGIFLPIVIGLVIFGWYAFKGEYDHLPEDSTEIE